MRKFCSIILIVFLSGCVMRSGGGGSSFDGLSNRYGGDAQVFADRTAQELGRRYTPAQNPVTLQKAPGIFGDSLEQALRNRGFAVSSPENGGASGLPVSYTVDILEMDGVPTKGYVQVTCADGRVFTFSRELEHGAVVPTNAPPNVPQNASMTLDENNPATVPVPAPVQEVALPVAQAPAALPVQPVTTVPSPASLSALPPHTIRASATATRIAKRNNLSVANFCRWNGIAPDQTLPKGHRVHLQEPAQVSIPVASSVAPIAQAVPAASVTPFAGRPAIASAPPAVQPVPLPIAASEVLPTPVQDAKHSDAKEEIPAPSLPETAPMSTWTITPGNLQAQVSAWSAQANYQLLWKTQNDFEMESHARFQGDFLDAIRQLFTGLQRSGHALRVTLYQGNNVLEVSEE